MNIRWVIIFLFAGLLGFSFVRYLVESPQLMGYYMVLCVLLIIALLLLLGLHLHGMARLAGAGVLICGFAIGYIATTYAFLYQEEHRDLPVLSLPPPEERDHTAVIYFTHGEPPAYSPMPWVETFKELDADKVSFIPTPFRPFFFLAFRDEYLRVGGSPHNYIHQDMARSLKEVFRAAGDENTRFYVAFLDSNPRPDEAVIRALNAGANKVILATVFVTVSSHTKAGQDMVAELNLDGYGVPICFSEPLWNSETLQDMFLVRAEEHRNGTDRSKVGVLLVGHGQPEDWDKIYPTQTEQELLFRQSIIKKMVAAGYLEENISLAWMEFKEPKIGQVARELGNKGIEKIFVYATSISASSLHSLYDIPEAVHQAGLPSDIEIVNLGAWDDDPIVIRAIKERVDACR